MKKIICFVSLVAFLMAGMPVTLHSEEQPSKIKLRTVKHYNITEEQLESLKTSPGMTFYTELPETLPAKYLAVVVPQQLGEGYLVGTAEDIASAFNDSGVTVGLKPSAVTRLNAGLVGGTAAVILGVVLSMATGSSKPLVSQAYSKAKVAAEVKAAEKTDVKDIDCSQYGPPVGPDNYSPWPPPPDFSVEHGYAHCMATQHPGWPWDF